MKRVLGFLSLLALLCATLSVVSVPTMASGGSGGGGGGSTPKPVEYRVTGYVTAIDYVHSTITVGASYYGTGVLQVTSSTNISLDNVSCSFSAIKLGDWAEARYLWPSKVATKLSCISM